MSRKTQLTPGGIPGRIQTFINKASNVRKQITALRVFGVPGALGILRSVLSFGNIRRAYAVNAEDRTFSVNAEDRNYAVNK